MYGFTDFQPSSSIEMPTTAKPPSRYFPANSVNHGISTWQPPHQVAQKFNNTTLPFRAEIRTGLPEASFKSKSGAILRSGWGNRLAARTALEFERPCHRAIEQSTQR